MSPSFRRGKIVNSQRVLVTGANGFVGRWLVPYLAGARVRRALRREGQAPLAGAEDVAIGDIGPKTDWTRALDGVETVIHLAGRAHVFDRAGVEDELSFQRVNAGGVESLLRDALRCGVRRIVFMSSVAVLGSETAEGRPWTESSPLAPMSAYARSKARAEEILRSAGTAVATVVVRPPLIYGPGAPGNFFRLARWIASGVPLPFQSVRNRRSFMFIGNLCEALRLAATHPRAAGGTFLVADGENFSLPDWVRLLAAGLGRRARLFPVPPALLRTGLRCLGRGDLADKLLGTLEIDAGHATRTLGFRPPWTVAEGVRWTFSKAPQPTMAALGKC